MNSKNIVAVVGKPNVGKSTLFNRLAGHRISIVHEEPGITRDRVEVRMRWADKSLRLIDTGGVDVAKKDTIHQQVLLQVKKILKEANLIIFVVDVRDGITPLDEDVAQLIRRWGRKSILIVNKVDNKNAEISAQEFYRLGFDTLIMVSALHGLGFSELQDEIEANLESYLEEEEEERIRVAVVGKPNAGKSTLINQLLGENRLIVDSVPGTTRDSIDVDIKIRDHAFTFVDTAGMRKRKQVRTGPETFSIFRALLSIRRADLVILVLDAVEGVTAQDVRILDHVRRQSKGCILVINKWDLIRKVKEEDFTKMIIQRWKFLEIYPQVFCSALKGINIERMIDLLIDVNENTRRMVSDEELEDFLSDILQTLQPPSQEGRIPRLFLMNQAGVKPTRIHIYTDHPDWVKESYKFYIERAFRKRFRFFGVPLQFKYKKGKK